MKTPPLLLFATLAFWGWQSDLLVYGLIAGAMLEAARFTRFRWELEDVDFNRIWTLCIVVTVAVGAYVFTTSQEGGGVHGLFGGLSGLRRATASSSVATNSIIRWWPLLGFPFVAAQVYNVRPSVPLTAVSLVLRLRRRRGEQTLMGRYVDLSYPYFMVCLFSAGFHRNQATYTYFAGLVVLVLWMFWALRSPRYGLKSWIACLASIALLGLVGLFAINRAEHWVQDFDARFIARLFRARTDPSQSTTAIGQIGELELSPRIVIRLEPGRLGVVPPYLREATYRNYGAHNQTWFSGGAKNDFAPVQSESDGSTWRLLPGKNTANTVSIACYLEGHSEGVPEGILPLPSGVARLEKLPAGSTTIQTNETGVVLASGLGLLIFDAVYGPGPTIDSPPGTNRLDLMVPTNEVPALAKALAEMNVATNADDQDKRAAVQQFFARNFTYSSWQGLDKRRTTNASPLTRFLLTSRSGHCEYFATATVLLLRELGVPARYAVGYAVHETSGSGYVVRERDAHAWCLVWNRQTGAWEDFDTTPSSWIAVEGNRNSPLDALSDLRSWLVFQYEKLRWRQADLRPYILWTTVPMMVVLLYYIFFQRRRRFRAAAKAAGAGAVIWPGHDSAFYRLETALAAGGLPRQPHEPLSVWLERVLAEPGRAELRAPLQELLRLHYRYRFDPRGLNDAEKEMFLEQVELVLETLAQKPVAA